MSSPDPSSAPLNDPDHNAADADRCAQSIQTEARKQNRYLRWAHQRWERANRAADCQRHRSHQRLVEAEQNRQNDTSG